MLSRDAETRWIAFTLTPYNQIRFGLELNGKVVDAKYTGVVPDTFKDTPGEEAEVVLKGRLNGDGFHVDPNGVMAKCPSKYEPSKKVG